MLNIGSNIIETRVDGSLKALRRDLDVFAGIGLTAAEIPVHAVDAIRNGRLDRRRTALVASILADYPFAASVHLPNPLNLMDRHQPELHLDVLYASLEFTAAIGARCLVYYPGRYLPEEEFAIRGPKVLSDSEEKRLLDREAEMLREVAVEFPEVVIAMENARPYLYHSPYCYAELPHELVAQIDRIDRANVRMTLDFGHLHLSSRFYQLDPIAEARIAAPHIVHCHVHDNFGGSVYHSEKNQCHQIPFGRGDSHMPVGWGSVPFADIFAEFIAGYEGLLICELRGRYFDDTGEAARNLAGILRPLGVAIAPGLQN